MSAVVSDIADPEYVVDTSQDAVAVPTEQGTEKSNTAITTGESMSAVVSDIADPEDDVDTSQDAVALPTEQGTEKSNTAITTGESVSAIADTRDPVGT